MAARHRVHAVQGQGGRGEQGVGAGEAEVAGRGGKRRDAGRVQGAVARGRVGVVREVVLVVVEVVVDVGGVDLEEGRRAGGGVRLTKCGRWVKPGARLSSSPYLVVEFVQPGLVVVR